MGRAGDRGLGGAPRAGGPVRPRGRECGQGGGSYRPHLRARCRRGGCVSGPRHRVRVLMTAGAVGGVWTYACGVGREWMPEPWADVDRAGEWLVRLARAEGAELVHLNGYAHGVLDFGVPKL